MVLFFRLSLNYVYLNGRSRKEPSFFVHSNLVRGAGHPIRFSLHSLMNVNATLLTQLYRNTVRYGTS